MKLTDLLVKRNVDRFKNEIGTKLGFDPVEELGIKLESGLSGLELNLDNVRNEKFLELFEAFKNWAKDSGFSTDKDWQTFQETLTDTLRTELSGGIEESKFQDVFEKAAKALEGYIANSGLEHLVKGVKFETYLPELTI